jgi:hypothetical protein
MSAAIAYRLGQQKVFEFVGGGCGGKVTVAAADVVARSQWRRRL